MDGRRFDGLTRSLASGVSRRSLIKGLFAGGAAVAVTSRAIAAQDVCDCGTGYICCNGGCILEGETCCGEGYCPETDVCCGDLNCCPSGGGYECNGTECCQSCDYFEGECGEIRAYCGNTPTTITCGCGAGLTCCNGSCEACCEDSDCGAEEYCDSGTCMPYCEPGEIRCGVDNCCSDADCCCDDGSCSAACCESTCTSDYDCGKDGCCCKNGSCSSDCCEATICASDKECGQGSCCCNDGTCSGSCCPPKPDGPDEVGGTAATVQLPNTGSGENGGNESNVVAAAIVAAGAAAIIGTKLKSDSTGADQPDTSKLI